MIKFLVKDRFSISSLFFSGVILAALQDENYPAAAAILIGGVAFCVLMDKLAARAEA